MKHSQSLGIDLSGLDTEPFCSTVHTVTDRRLHAVVVNAQQVVLSLEARAILTKALFSGS